MKSILTGPQRRVAFFNASEPLLTRLAERWLDEAGYESIEGYKVVILKSAHWAALKAAGAVFGKMTKRPFGFTYSMDQKTFRVSVGASGSYSYKEIA